MAPPLVKFPCPPPAGVSTSNNVNQKKNRGPDTLPLYEEGGPPHGGESSIGPLPPKAFTSLARTELKDHITGIYVVKLPHKNPHRFDVCFKNYDGGIDTCIYLENHIKRQAQLGAFSQNRLASIGVVARETPINIMAMSFWGRAHISLPHDFDGILKLRSRRGFVQLKGSLPNTAVLIEGQSSQFSTATYRIRPAAAAACPTYPPVYTAKAKPKPIPISQDQSNQNDRFSTPSWAKPFLNFNINIKGSGNEAGEGPDRAAATSARDIATASYFGECCFRQHYYHDAT